jgi:CHAT domain-containing protein
VLAVLRQQAAGRSPAPRAVAVLADPVFDKNDVRAAARQSGPSRAKSKTSNTRSWVEDKGELHLPRLVFSRREAQAIVAVSPTEKSAKFLDFQANRSVATNAEMQLYRTIHFATHGLLDSDHPELSGLVLSMVNKQGEPQNGFLGLQDIYNLKLRADLVVLSSCETGLGKQVNGEGLVGLTRGFMYAGSSRVVASLWNVSDIATARLMASFYKAMEQRKVPPAAALREAQLEMWKQLRWKSPYYWAAFQIQGEWR